MKKLHILVVATLFGLIGSNWIEGVMGGFSSGAFGGSSMQKTVCKASGKKWDKLANKCVDKTQPKAIVPTVGVLNNMLASSMPVTFYTAQGGTVVASALPNSTIPGNDGISTNYFIAIPATATYVTVGPDDNDTNSGQATASLSGLIGQPYQITVDNEGMLVVKAA
jgi:hypothetical protein